MNLRTTGRAFSVVALLALLACGDPKPAPAAPSPGSQPARPLVVGFAQVGAESAWRTAETQSIRDAARERGIELKFSDAQGKQENQIKAIRAFIAAGVDAILLAPSVEAGFEPVLREAKAAKMPVVLVDRGVTVSDDTLYATLIAADFVAEGRMAAEWLVKKTGGKCRIVELQGSPGSAPAIDRRKGFAEAIRGHPGMTIVDSQSGDFSREGGKNVMEALLKVHPDLQAVYAHNDDMALGAIQALQAAGKAPGRDVLVVSIDAVRGALEAMAAGTLNCTVECNPLLGPMAFDAIQKAARGEKLERWSVVPGRLFEQDQARDLLPGRKY